MRNCEQYAVVFRFDASVSLEDKERMLNEALAQFQYTVAEYLPTVEVFIDDKYSYDVDGCEVELIIEDDQN